MAIRNAAKAIVLSKGKILLNKCISESGEVYYDLPGGGQNQFESMEEAVKREVLEETGYKVKIIRFTALAEEMYDNVKLREKYINYTHRIFHIFLCELREETIYEKTEMDDQQDESVWISIEEVDLLNMWPSSLSGHLSQLINSKAPQYFRCVHIA